LGAAYLAGLGEGVWSSTGELAGHWQEDRAFHPRKDPQIEDGYRSWRRAVERALGWADPEARASHPEPLGGRGTPPDPR